MTDQEGKSTKEHSPPRDWPYSVRLISAVLWLVLGLGLLLLAQPVWYLISLALITAYLLQPLVEYSARLRIPRALSAAILIVVLIVILTLLPIILVPALFNDIEPISIDVDALWNGTVIWVNQLPDTYPGITLFGFELGFKPFYDEFFAYIDSLGSVIQIGMPTNLAGFLQDALSSATQVVGVATSVATNVIGRVAVIFFRLLLLLLLTFYFTTDLPRLRRTVVNLAPDSYQSEWAELWRRTGGIWNSFFRGQIVLSIVVGTTVWMGLSIVGVPGALVLGIFAGILEVLPNLGPVLAAIPAVLIALLQGSTQYPEMSHLTIALIAVALYAVIQQLENYILVPRILGGSVGVHPAVILVSVTIFTIQFGILGAFIATPVIATALTWFRYYHARILGRQPYIEAVPKIPIPQKEPASEAEAQLDSEQPIAVGDREDGEENEKLVSIDTPDGGSLDMPAEA